MRFSPLPAALMLPAVAFTQAIQTIQATPDPHSPSSFFFVIPLQREGICISMTPSPPRVKLSAMPHPRLLLFDLDGTLIDSTVDLCNSVNAMLEHFNKPTLPNAVIAGYIGDGAAMLVRRALGDPGDLDSPLHDEAFLRDALSYFIAWYRIHKLDTTTLYPGVLDALETIRAAHPGILMAVLTNKPVAPSREICRLLRIGPFFFQNYGGDSFPTKKPDPQGFQSLVAEANAILAQRSEPALQPQEVVMIGDSDVDVITGRRCGARTIGCTFGIHPHAMQAAAPDILVHHASEWISALGLAAG